MIRRFRDSDREAVAALGAHQDFPYPPIDELALSVWVATDEDDVPIAALVARQAAHLYFYLSPEAHPAVALESGRELLSKIGADLCKNGLLDAESFVSPQIEKSFGRHLAKHFRAIKNWTSWNIKFL